MNATVTLPISELDNLRDTIKDQANEINILKQNERTMVVKEIKFETETYVDPNGNPFDRFGQARLRERRVEVTHYKNLDDVMEPLKNKAREDISKEVVGIRNDMIIWKDKYNAREKKITELEVALGKKQEDESVISLEKNIKEMEVHYQRIKNDLDAAIVYCNQQIIKLQAKIVFLQGRKWWQVLFNKNRNY